MSSATTAPRGPELLLPAGDLERMRTAFDFGADAVYAGQPRYSLRARNNDFRLEQLKQGIAEAHARGKRFFVASNLLPHDLKVKTYLRDMEEVIAMKPDALIMADPGLIMLVRERWPDVAVHLSVQANTMNHAAVRFWQKQGIRRVILSRELSVDEVAHIRQECPDVELEVFVHGALCIAYSGRCLLSGYFNHRDANQGTCTNACRWDYKVYALEESQRPGEMMAIEEDEHGTYIMNSKDLRAIELVQKLVDIGVDSLKIEGRTKSRYYVARTAQAYRRAIDDALAGKPFQTELIGQLEGLANRGYTTGFLQRQRPQDTQNYTAGSSVSQRSLFVGEVQDIEGGWATIEVKNRFAVGDTLEIIHPQGNGLMQVTALRNREGQEMQVASGSGVFTQMPLDERWSGALLARMLTEGEDAAQAGGSAALAQGA